MKYPYAVKINGQIYPANTEIELKAEEDVETSGEGNKNKKGPKKDGK
ncbi:MAG: hypothetical protein NC110_06630 [Ruminococcus sp.]|nr:hypothetical protein [Ruminococcus sp.]